MVTLPSEFVATKFPGYFWNTKDKKLYSIKVSGALRPLAFKKPNHWNHMTAGYSVSVNGRRRFLAHDLLLKLKPNVNHVIPYQHQLKLF